MKSQPVILGHVKKNSRQWIRVAIDSHGRRTFLDVRVFALGKDGEPRPTKQGVALSLDRIRDLRRLIDLALKHVERLNETESL